MKLPGPLVQLFSILGGLCFFLLLSCRSPSIYYPNEAYTLGVSKKGDLKMAGGYWPSETRGRFGSTKRKREEYNVQFAYSPINKFALAGNYYKLRSRNVEDPTTWDLEQAEVALGYYRKKKLKMGEGNSYFLNEFYTGTGWGNSNTLFSTAAESHLNYQRYFIHSGNQFCWQNNIALGLGLRYVHLRYKEATAFGPIPYDFQENISFIDNKESINFLETTLSLHAGNHYFKIFTSFTAIIQHPSLSIPSNFNFPANYFGLVLNLDQFYKKKEKRNKW